MAENWDRQWRSSGIDSPGFNWKFYSDKNQGKWGEFKKFKGNRENNTNWEHYVRANDPLEEYWHKNIKGKQTRKEWGEQHWLNLGQYRGGGDRSKFDPGGKHAADAQGWITPQTIGPYGKTINTRRHSDTADSIEGLSPTNSRAFQDWLRRDYETKGKAAGLFGSKMEEWNDPDAIATRDQALKDFQQGLADDNKILQQAAASRAESLRLASSRGSWNQTQASSGTAAFKGKGLKASKNKRGGGRGTSQLRRPYGKSSLSINQKGQSLNL